jgi:hypothetical protein
MVLAGSVTADNHQYLVSSEHSFCVRVRKVVSLNLPQQPAFSSRSVYSMLAEVSLKPLSRQAALPDGNATSRLPLFEQACRIAADRCAAQRPRHFHMSSTHPIIGRFPALR